MPQANIKIDRSMLFLRQNMNSATEVTRIDVTSSLNENKTYFNDQNLI